MTDQNTHKIRKIVISTGVVTTLAGSGSAGSANGTGASASFNKPRGITTDGTDLYVNDESSYKIRRIAIATGVVTTIAGSGSAASIDGTGTSASFNGAVAISTAGTNLYVSENGGSKIRKIALRETVTADVAMHNLEDDTDVTVRLPSSDP